MIIKRIQIRGRTNKAESPFRLLSAILLVCIFFSLPSTSYPQLNRSDLPQLKKIDIKDRLGEYIPLQKEFINSSGDTIALARFFNRGKPVILVLAYYKCPMLCGYVLNGLAQTAPLINLKPGKDYYILTLSISPNETASLAAQKQATYLNLIDASPADSAWRFFVGKEDNIRAIASAIGFEYYYVPERDDYAHPAVLTVLSDKGKISRYLYGISFKPNDLKLSLLEASQGKVGNTIDKLLLYCYHFDPQEGSYVVFATNVMKLGGAVTLLILFILLGTLWLREIRRKKALT